MYVLNHLHLHNHKEFNIWGDITFVLQFLYRMIINNRFLKVDIHLKLQGVNTFYSPNVWFRKDPLDRFYIQMVICQNWMRVQGKVTVNPLPVSSIQYVVWYVSLAANLLQGSIMCNCLYKKADEWAPRFL